jgi:flavodoxin
MKKKVLIVYASNSGGTFLVAEAIQKVLGKKHQVAMQKAADTKPDDLYKYDVLIFGSPSWHIAGMGDGLPQETMLALTRKCAGKKLPNKQSAIFGCGDRAYTFFCGAVSYLENFAASVGAERIIDSLRIGGYFFDLEKNEKIVQKWAAELIKKISAL